MLATRSCAGSCCDGMLASFFFFQAEDGIRDLTVTGVQTCALPISCNTRGLAQTIAAAPQEEPGQPHPGQQTEKPGQRPQHDHRGLVAGQVLAIHYENQARSEEHTSELQSQSNLVCRLLLEKKKKHLLHPL